MKEGAISLVILYRYNIICQSQGRFMIILVRSPISFRRGRVSPAAHIPQQTPECVPSSRTNPGTALTKVVNCLPSAVIYLT